MWPIHRFNCGELPIPEHDRPGITKISYAESAGLLGMIELTSYEDEEYDDEGPEVKREKKLKREEEARREAEKEKKRLIVESNRSNNKEVKMKGKSMKEMLDRREA